jgi:hypothetical protein
VHFARAGERSLPVPDDIRGIPRPIAGYVGAIKDLDVALIRRLALARPDVSFVFIGEVYMDLSALAGIPNIHVLGKKAYEALPNSMQMFDCCGLYYATGDAFNDYRNPKKLLEYLATGIPVVSVRLRELERFREHVYVADSHEAFEHTLRSALEEDAPQRRERRIAYAMRHTWDDAAAAASEPILAWLERQTVDHRP